MSSSIPSSRRRFLKAGVATAAGVVLPGWTLVKGAPAIITSDTERPQALQGVQFGDPGNGAVVVWSRSDRDARMLVEWSYDEQFQGVHRVVGPYALDTTDFTARQDLEGLEPGSEVFVRVSFQSLSNARAVGEPVTGRFVVPPDELVRDGRRPGHAGRDLRFLWGGDTAGQGWGINPGFGGMKIYEAMRQRRPLFFIHSGDTIYADGPIAESVVAENGLVWNNLVTPQVGKVAETLD
jgi:alkaline phosphatase D